MSLLTKIIYNISPKIKKKSLAGTNLTEEDYQSIFIEDKDSEMPTSELLRKVLQFLQNLPQLMENSTKMVTLESRRK